MEERRRGLGRYKVEVHGYETTIMKDKGTLEEKGVKERMPSSTLHKEEPSSERVAKEVGESVKGAVIISNVLSESEAHSMIRCAEYLGFDNSHHPDYQSKYIDKKEEEFRRNERCVYRAAPEEVALLYSRVSNYLPKEVDLGEFGSFRLCDINDLWRFYKYNAADNEEDAKKGKSQSFPLHFDNVTVKTQNLISIHSILFYLSAGGFGGGQTIFYSRKTINEIANVNPIIGQAVYFYHIGPLSPLHSGAPLWRLLIDQQFDQSIVDEKLVKYVMRTDSLYERISPGIPLQLTAPFNKRAYHPKSYDLSRNISSPRCCNPFCRILLSSDLQNTNIVTGDIDHDDPIVVGDSNQSIDSAGGKMFYCSDECKKKLSGEHL